MKKLIKVLKKIFTDNELNWEITDCGKFVR